MVRELLFFDGLPFLHSVLGMLGFSSIPFITRNLRAELNSLFMSEMLSF
jgi:hypothetical protein